MDTTFIFYVLCAKFFADVIKANGVTISNRVDMPNSPVIYEAEATIFRNSPLVRKAVEELAEEDGHPEPFSPRLEICRKRSSQSDRIEGDQSIVKNDFPSETQCCSGRWGTSADWRRQPGRSGLALGDHFHPCAPQHHQLRPQVCRSEQVRFCRVSSVEIEKP